MEMPIRDDSTFLPIREAVRRVYQKVNLMAVVVEVALPRKSKGTDWYCKLKIIDESRPQTISVLFFEESEDLLPRVLAVGDIIVICRVTISHHNGEVNVVYNKKYSSFGLYGGKECDSDELLPYQLSKFLPSHLDLKFIKGLRKWLVDLQPDEGSSNFLFMKDIKEGKEIDLVLKILHVYEAAENEWMALVWDGTDSAPIGINPKLEDEMVDPLPLQPEPSPLPRDLLRTFPTVGTILRVVIGKGIEKYVLQFLNPGKWMKILNIRCEANAGMWHGMLGPYTRLRYTPNEDVLVLARQKAYDERLSSKLDHIPHWCLPWSSQQITEVDYDRVGFVTLMDVLTHSEVSYKVKCVVRVVAMFPYQVQDISYRSIYRFRLTIEDPTARIHSFVYGKDGEKLFGGFPSVDELTRKRNILLGVATNDDGGEIDAPRNPPWIQCCIKTYDDRWGRRHYRIFGTELRG